MFQSFVKELYRAMNFRDDYAQAGADKQIDYNFSTVLQFFDDMRFLSIRFGAQQLDDKFTMLENLQSKYIKDILDRGTENSKIKVIDKVTTDFIPEYLEQLKGSTLNLSTEIKSFAFNFSPIVEEKPEKIEKPSKPIIKTQSLDSKISEKEQEPSIGNGNAVQPDVQNQSQQQASQQNNFSQMSSKVSNDEVHSGSIIGNDDENIPLPDRTIPLIDPPHIWETKTISSSNLSNIRKQYTIQNMNLLQKKHIFRKKIQMDEDAAESEEDEVQIFQQIILTKPSDQNKEMEFKEFIVTNINDKNLLQVNPNQNQDGNQSLAGRSQLNKSYYSLNPMIGDEHNPDQFHNKTFMLMGRNQNML